MATSHLQQNPLHIRYIHILTCLCNIIDSIVSNNMYLFQAFTLLASSSHGSYSLKDTQWLQCLLNKVTRPLAA